VEIIHKGTSHGLLVPVDLKINSEITRDKPVQGRLPFMSQEEQREL
jgi:hypothetical protein